MADFVTVRIQNDLTTTVDTDPYPRAWSEYAEWKITGVNNLPANAVVYVQFVVDTPVGKIPIAGPLYDGSKKGGKYKGNPNANTVFIGATVIGDAGGYQYQIGYELKGVLTPLLDPELVVDGESLASIKLIRAVEAAGKRRLKKLNAVQAKKNPTKAKKAKKR